MSMMGDFHWDQDVYGGQSYAEFLDKLKKIQNAVEQEPKDTPTEGKVDPKAVENALSGILSTRKVTDRVSLNVPISQLLGWLGLDDSYQWCKDNGDLHNVKTMRFEFVKYKEEKNGSAA